jgi:DNA (cytosine-5)-methyltransferase 1
LSLGFESAGFDVLSAVEYDPVHAAVHLYNFPLTDVICADVSNVTADQLIDSAKRGWALHHPGQEWDGVVDTIIGGPSCQGFSTMGKQDASDERNQLLFEFVRLVEEVRPKAFCMENVPGLLDPRFDAIRKRVLDRFRKAGYAVSGHDTVLRAEDYGVPQKRRRVVVTGLRDGVVPPSTPERTVFEPFTVADAFLALPAIHASQDRQTTDVISMDADLISRRVAPAGAYAERSGLFGDGTHAFGHARAINHRTLSGCRVTTHTAESVARFAATAQGTKEKVSRFHRLSENAPALTLRAGTGRERGAFSAARPIHPTESRVVTVREAARLHSFPDWFRFHTTNWHAHRQIGNAVPPLLAAAAARTIMASLGVEPAPSDRAPMAFGDEKLLTLSPTAAAAAMNVDEDQVPKRRRVVRADDPVERERERVGVA